MTHLTHQSIMGIWTRDIFTERRGSALFAALPSSQGTRIPNRSVALTSAEASFRLVGRHEGVRRAVVSSCLAEAYTRHARVDAAPLIGFHEEALTQWSLSGIDWQSFVAPSSQEVCERRPVRRRSFSGTQSRSCVLTWRLISKREWIGLTMEKRRANGA